MRQQPLMAHCSEDSDSSIDDIRADRQPSREGLIGAPAAAAADRRDPLQTGTSVLRLRALLQDEVADEVICHCLCNMTDLFRGTWRVKVQLNVFQQRGSNDLVHRDPVMIRSHSACLLRRAQTARMRYSSSAKYCATS